jgi:hypothetical protein
MVDLATILNAQGLNTEAKLVLILFLIMCLAIYALWVRSERRTDKIEAQALANKADCEAGRLKCEDSNRRIFNKLERQAGHIGFLTGALIQVNPTIAASVGEFLKDPPFETE